MTKRTAVCICLTVCLLLSLSACFGSATVISEPTTGGALPVNNDWTYAPLPTQAEMTTSPLGPELPTVEFREDYATFLGTIDSEIYGELDFYYQQDRILIFDSYDFKLFELYAEGYRPAGAVDVPDEIETEVPTGGEETTGEEETTEEETTEPPEEPDGFDASLSEVTDSSSVIMLTGEDINFDGYSDFYLLYSHGNLNTYYFCWLWDMDARRFVYYLPLSSIPSPVFDRTRLRVVSSDRRDARTLITTEYVWSGPDLIPVAHGETTLPETPTAAGGLEEADLSYSITNGRTNPTIQFRLNANSLSRWHCRIENQNVLRLVSDTPDVRTLTHRFGFRGMMPGTTTVVFRFATDWNSDFVAERVFNVSVDAYGRVSFRLTE